MDKTLLVAIAAGLRETARVLEGASAAPTLFKDTPEAAETTETASPEPKTWSDEVLAQQAEKQAASNTAREIKCAPGHYCDHGVEFDPEWCSEAKDPLNAEGKWKMKRGVNKDKFKQWYDAQIAAVAGGQPLTTEHTQRPAEPSGPLGREIWGDAQAFFLWIADEGTKAPEKCAKIWALLGCGPNAVVNAIEADGESLRRSFWDRYNADES